MLRLMRSESEATHCPAQTESDFISNKILMSAIWLAPILRTFVQRHVEQTHGAYTTGAQ